MQTINGVLGKYGGEIWLQVALVCFAAFLYGATIFDLPLVDYDEATYAKVIVHTLESGDISNFTLDGANWFEKPPLYLWLSMISVKIFGEHEFAFRIPSVLASLVCLWLVYAIVKELGGNSLTATSAFLVLLFTPPFFVFAREARLDSGVIMAILAALFFWVKGRQDDKLLFWILPALAIGFLFKSVIVFLAAPILLFYSFAHRHWVWIWSKYFWWGLFPALSILLPWHLAETIRFGASFWNEYLGYHILRRSVITITGTDNYYDYVRVLWLYYQPWIWVTGVAFFVLTIASFSKVHRIAIQWKHLLPPIASALFVFLLFTIVRTHLSTYIMPAFPFLAIFIAFAMHYASSLTQKGAYIFIGAILMLSIFGGVRSFTALDELNTLVEYEERGAGIALKQHRESPARLKELAPAYALDWPQLETMNYYGDVRLQSLDPRTIGGVEIQGPFYLITTTIIENFFYAGVGLPLPGYESMEVLYQGEYAVLMYSEQSVRMPTLMVK